MNDNEKSIFNVKVTAFAEAKAQLDALKKSTDKLNLELKELFKKTGETVFVTDSGIKVSYSKQCRSSMNEDALLEHLKHLKSIGLDEVIATKEVVDMDALEQAIYDGKIEAASLAAFQTNKYVETLKLTAPKK